MRHTSKLIPLFLLFVVPVSFAQDITARFYPEKQEYVVGEPIVIVLEVTNGTSHAVEMEESGCDNWMNPTEFQVTNAPIVPKVSLFGCAPPSAMAIDCLMGAREIQARGTLRKRFLLNGATKTQFDVSSAGTYHIKATKTVTIDGNGFGNVIASIDAENEFDILVREPADGELEARYAAYVKDLGSSDYGSRVFAAQALTQDPPKFLEPVVLSLAGSDDQDLRFPSINGLKRLATPAARAKLMKMASGSDESLAQEAIPALAEIANPDDCAAMLRIAARTTQYTQNQAYMAAGRICREKAVPTLTGVLSRAGEQLAESAATALGNTGSREAVSPLINLLASRDQWVRAEADNALFTLTHRAVQDVSTPAAAAQVSSDWRSWWLMNSDSSTIYGPDQCPVTAAQ